MTLSDKAESGKKIAVAAAVMCFAISFFSVISFNFLMAAMGFAAAYHLGKGSLTARNFTIILRIADIPVMGVLVWIASVFAEDFVPQFIAAAAAAAVLDMIVLLILFFSSSVNTYFREVYENNKDDE